MGQISNIEKLPNELRLYLIKLLENPNCTQQEVAELVNDKAGAKVVSKSSVNRYAIKMKEFSERNRQAREVAKVYLASCEEDTGVELSKVVTEQIRMLVFDLLMASNNLKEAENSEQIQEMAFTASKLARAVKDIESATTINMEREEKMKKKAEATAASVEKKIKASGLSDNTIEEIKAQILGIVK